MFTVNDLIDEAGYKETGLVVAAKIIAALCVFSAIALTLSITEPIVQKEEAAPVETGVVQLKMSTLMKATPADFAQALQNGNAGDLYLKAANAPSTFNFKHDAEVFTVVCDNNVVYDVTFSGEQETLGFIRVTKYAVVNNENQRLS